MKPQIKLLHGDCLEMMKTLPDQSVQTIVTSPPYWGLRDYGISGQMGLEPTYMDYVEKMVMVFREARRVLRNDGTLWLNLGDSYNTQPAGNKTPSGLSQVGSDIDNNAIVQYGHGRKGLPAPSLKPKDMVGIPWRVAFALQEDGWYLRSDIIWAKTNPMPESVTDRPTKAHEYIFLFAKSQRYFYDVEAVKEPAAWERWGKQTIGKQYRGINPVDMDTLDERRLAGRNRRTVWTVASKPYKGAHFATYPPKLIEPCILAGTSERGCCPVCGAPWKRIAKRNIPTRTMRDGEWEEDAAEMGITGTEGRNGRARVGLDRKSAEEKAPGYTTIDWEPTCQHNNDPIPCTVLDPFNGAGTTGLVASQHGRSYIGIDLNAVYLDLTITRLGLEE